MRNKIKRLACFVIILITYSLYAQNSIITSSNYNNKLNDAITLLQQGQYMEALSELSNIKDYLEKNTAFNEADYCTVVIGLYSCYNLMGNYSANKQLILNSLKAYEENGCKFNSDYTRQLWLCLGKIEGQLKNYDMALEYFHTLQNMFEEDVDYGDSYLVLMMNMGYVYMEKEDYLSAKLYIDEAIDIFEKLSGYTIFETNRFDEARKMENYMILNLYGALCYQINDLYLSEKCFSTIYNEISLGNIPKGIGGETYYQAINNLANIYIQQRKWNDAKAILKEISDNESGINDLDYVISQNLLLCELFLCDRKEIVSTFLKLNDKARFCALSAFTNLTESERDNYWSDLSWTHIITNTLVANYSSNDTLCGEAYNNVLMATWLMLRSSVLIDKYVSLQQNSLLKEKYIKYQKLREKFSYKATKTDSQRHNEIFQQLDELERDIYRSIPNLSNLLQNEIVTWKKIQESLDEHELAIEFTYIPVILQWPEKIKKSYGAFILGKNFKFPKLIVLEEYEIIDKIIVDNNPDEFFINHLSLVSTKNLDD